jgi:hemolysin activation/secretion protein
VFLKHAVNVRRQLTSLTCILCFAASANAQSGSSGLGGALGAPGSARQTLPQFVPKPDTPPAVTAPPQEAPPPVSHLSDAPKFLLRAVKVEGSTILSEDRIQEIVKPYLEHEVDTNDLEEIRRALTLTYVQHGYINSGAVLPDQTVDGGVVTYRVIEGKVSDINITGLERLDPDYLRGRLESATQPPFNVNRLEERVKILLQDPNIDHLNVDIEPGADPGLALLGVRAAETDRFSLGLSIANDSPPSTGPILGQITGTYRDFTGEGDIASLTYGRTDGINEGSASWSIPVTRWDTRVSVRFDLNDSVVLDQVFRDLNIVSRTNTISLAVEQPIYRDGDDTLTLGLQLDRRISKTYLLDFPFDFDAGSVNGTARATVLRVSADYLSRSAVDVIAARTTFSFGLPIFAATNSPTEPNANFQTWLSQFQYVRQVWGDDLIVFRLDAQFTRQPLFSFEQIAIGGEDTVRGYRENQLVRDNGVILSIEGRIPLFDLGVPQFGGKPPIGGVVQIVPFVDYGNGWDAGPKTPPPSDIASIGLGFRWDLESHFHASIDWGHALRPIHNVGHDLQDSGVHFRVAADM